MISAGDFRNGVTLEIDEMCIRDRDIGNDRWQWSQEFVPVAEQVGKAGTQ